MEAWHPLPVTSRQRSHAPRTIARCICAELPARSFSSDAPCSRDALPPTRSKSYVRRGERRSACRATPREKDDVIHCKFVTRGEALRYPRLVLRGGCASVDALLRMTPLVNRDQRAKRDEEMNAPATIANAARARIREASTEIKHSLRAIAAGQPGRTRAGTTCASRMWCRFAARLVSAKSASRALHGTRSCMEQDHRFRGCVFLWLAGLLATRSVCRIITRNGLLISIPPDIITRHNLGVCQIEAGNQHCSFRQPVSANVDMAYCCQEASVSLLLS